LGLASHHTAQQYIHTLQEPDDSHSHQQYGNNIQEDSHIPSIAGGTYNHANIQVLLPAIPRPSFTPKGQNNVD
jgi:hypothetical protein